MHVRIGIALGLNRVRTRLLGRVAAHVQQQAIERRVSSREPAPRPRPIEVVWRRTSSIEERAEPWVPHRIVRRTDESLLIEAEPFEPDRQPLDSGSNRRLRTYWVDRSDLKRFGFARARSRTWVFFASPKVSDEFVDAVHAVIRLGLWWPFTHADVRTAYLRRATETHPDAGGSQSAFVRLQRDYELALSVLREI